MSKHDLISRDALVADLKLRIENNRRLKAHASADHLQNVLDMIERQPAVRPQVVINVTGGVADVVAATHYVDVNVLDYDINDNEQSDYVIDEDGDQAWFYGECITPNPEEVEKILNYPTVEDEQGQRKVALVTSQGTACSETVLVEDEDTPENRKRVEGLFCNPDDPDAPLPGTWTDVTDNEAC